MFVNPIAAVLVLAGVFRSILQRRLAMHGSRTSTCAEPVLATGGMLVLVYALVEAPDVGWETGAHDPGGGSCGGSLLLAAFVVDEQRVKGTRSCATVHFPHQRARILRTPPS